jgi:putative membrane protein
MRLILLWLLNACALLAVAYLMPASIQLASFGTAMIAAVLLGLVNTALRPLLVLLTLPVTLLSFGLFLLVVNGLMFWLAGSLLEGFVVSGFWPGVFGALLYSIIASLLSSLLTTRKGQ